MNSRDIADRLGAEHVGEDIRITGLASLSGASPSDLSFLEDLKFLRDAAGSSAGALIVPETALEKLPNRTLLVAQHVRLAFAKAGELFSGTASNAAAIDASAVIDPSSSIGDRASIGPLTFIGPGVKVGRGTVIGPNCALLGDCEIGEDCHLVARVAVYPKTKVGDRAVLHAGCVLGSDGFGFVPDEQGRYHKFPQIGTLTIGNDVEIGANSTVDRGALDATVISDGVKLDNLVHVGHNVRIGENVVVAAQTGVSGSSVIEKNVIVAGQVGIADHVTIEEGAILGAQSGIPSNKVIRGKGVLFWGTPARPIREYLKELAALARLARKK